MTIREALDYVFYNVNFQEPCCEEDEIKRIKAIKIIIDMADDFEKYEKALEIIARKLDPSVIKQNSYYYLVIPHPSPYHDSTYRFLLEEEGQILFELFGGTNYDTK